MSPVRGQKHQMWLCFKTQHFGDDLGWWSSTNPCTDPERSCGTDAECSDRCMDVMTPRPNIMVLGCCVVHSVQIS